MALPIIKRDIDIDRLRAALDYDPNTGLLSWRYAKSRRVKAGWTAGYVGNHGYIKIHFDDRYWLAHRLAWAHVHGHLPPGLLDHINRIKHDNRIANLRLATPTLNAVNNIKVIGALGATFIAKKRRWQAQIAVNKRTIYLGSFLTQEEAHAAYTKAAKQREYS